MKRATVGPRPLHVTLASLDSAKPAVALGPPEGISPFSARILDQLSLTSWLPAALVVANAYLVAGMYQVAEADAAPTLDNLVGAIQILNDKPVGVLIAAIAGVVLVALVTQSLEFAAIRFLEGYWGGSTLAALPWWAGTRVQRLRLALLDRRAGKLERRAFHSAESRIKRELRAQPEVATAVLRVGRGEPTAHLDRERVKAARAYYEKRTWMRWATADVRNRANSLYIRRAAYPGVPSRLLPTRLGNALRSAEEHLPGDVSGPKMRGYLYEHLDSIGPTLMHQHNQYRNRLDMYAVMTLLSVILAALNALLLPEVLPTPAVIAAVTGLLTLSYFSYRGAVAAALDYGPIVVAIGHSIHRTRTPSSR